MCIQSPSSFSTHEFICDLPAVWHGDGLADLPGHGLAVLGAAVARLAAGAAGPVATLALVEHLGAALVLPLGGAALLGIKKEKRKTRIKDVFVKNPYAGGKSIFRPFQLLF